MGLRVFAYLPAAAWAAFLLYLGSREFSSIPSYDLPLDKLAHFVLYGILGGLAAAGWRAVGRKPHILIPLVAALAVGAVDEIRQGSVPERSASWADWGADAAAIALVFGLAARTRQGSTEEERP